VVVLPGHDARVRRLLRAIAAVLLAPRDHVQLVEPGAHDEHVARRGVLGLGRERPSVADAGVKFVWLKSAHGANSIDGCFKLNVPKAVEAFEFVGSYVWYKPFQDPIKQAENFARATEDLYKRARTPLPPMFDFEDDARLDPRGPCRGNALVSRAQTCVLEIERLTGMRMVVYTGKWFWQDAVGTLNAAVLQSRPLCHAQYPSTTRSGGKHSPEYVAAVRALGTPSLPVPWAQQTFWQFDGDGGLYLPQGVDSDFDVFGGTEDQLRIFCCQAQVHVREAGLQLGNADTVPATTIADEVHRIQTDADANAITEPGTPRTKSSQRMQAVKIPGEK